MTKIYTDILNGGRYYVDQNGTPLPGVTTILSATRFVDPEYDGGLERWKARVGEDEAERIRVSSTETGTVVHDLIDDYLLSRYDYLGFGGTGDENGRIKASEYVSRHKDILSVCPEKYLEAVYDMYNALKKSDILQNQIKYIVGSESPIHNVIRKSKDGRFSIGYAGRFDLLVCLKDGTFALIDFKTSKKPKEMKYLKDYQQQLAAYTFGLYDLYGINITEAHNLIAVASGTLQTFSYDLSFLKESYNMFVKKVFKFYEVEFIPNVLEKGILEMYKK